MSLVEMAYMRGNARRAEGPQTVAALIEESANRHAAAPALLAPGRRALSYGELWRQSLNIGEELRRRGQGPRARVAVAMPAGPDMAAAYLAMVTHACCIPLNPSAQAAELRRWFEITGVTCLLAAHDDPGPARQVARDLQLPIVEVTRDDRAPAGMLQVTRSCDAAGPVVPCEPTAVALIVQTSGTTGEPKAVGLTNEGLVASVLSMIDAYQLTAADCTINVRPMYHVASLITNTLAPLASGGRVVYAPGFDGDSLFDWFTEFRPTWFSGVTTMYQWWLDHAQDYRRKVGDHRFRFLRAGSAALPPSVMRRIEELTGSPLIETYGMSERTPIAANPLPPGLRKPGSVGRPCSVDVQLFDAEDQPVPPGHVGEIAIRAPGVAGELIGTHGRWFRTGDCGRFDTDGYLMITGRLKEMINRGGQKIAPREVDEQLLEHPAVSQAAAFGVPHPSLGEDVAAAIVLNVGAVAGTGEFRRYLHGRMAPYKIPTTIVFVSSLPLGRTGKVNRAELTARFGGRSVAEIELPRSSTELTVASIFADVLGRRAHIGRQESFFALGGDSISGARVLGRVARAFGIELPADTLFRQPSVSELAAIVDSWTEQADAIASQIAALTDEEVAALLEREDGHTT